MNTTTIDDIASRTSLMIEMASWTLKQARDVADSDSEHAQRLIAKVEGYALAISVMADMSERKVWAAISSKVES